MSKFLDKVMEIMGADEDLYLEDAAAEEKEEKETEEKKKFINIPKTFKKEREDVKSARPQERTYNQQHSSQIDYRKNKVVNMGNQSQYNMVITQPKEYADTKDIINHLKARKPVIVNLENLDKVTAKKVVDFISGAVYALDGSMQKISNGIIAAAPSNINITGNIGEQLNLYLFEEFKIDL